MIKFAVHYGAVILKIIKNFNIKKINIKKCNVLELPNQKPSVLE